MKLRELGTIITGNTPSKSNKEFYNSNDICFFKPSDFSENIINELSVSEEYISESARSNARILPKNTVLMTCIGTIGKVGLLKQESTCNQQINAIITNEKIIPEYLCYLLLSKKQYLQKKANAPVVPIINKTAFSNIEVNIHNISEQERIVKKLNKIDKLINSRKSGIEKLNELIKSQFVEMFGNPLFSDNNSVSMTEVCEIIDGDRGSNYPKQSDFFEKEYCLFLNAKNVTDHGFDFTNNMFITKEKDEQLRKGKLKRGDVVLTTRGTVGNLAFYDNNVIYENMRINSGMVILRMNKEKLNERFFVEQFKFQLDNIKLKIANGSAQPQLPISKMNAIKLLLPDIELQNKFASTVEQIDKQKFEFEKSLKKLEALQASLMQEYFG